MFDSQLIYSPNVTVANQAARASHSNRLAARPCPVQLATPEANGDFRTERKLSKCGAAVIEGNWSDSGLLREMRKTTFSA